MTSESHRPSSQLDAARSTEPGQDRDHLSAAFVHQDIRWTPTWSFAVIVACLTASLLLKITFISGPSHGSDDVRYLRSASAMLGMQSVDVLDHAASRLGFLSSP